LGAQLDVVLIADDDLVAREGPDAEALLLAMVNVIDGIYVMQAGVHLNVAELALLDAQSSPSESDPFALLNELEDYKLVTPARRSAGLLHLFTGRDLDEPDGRDGDIVGVANIGVLCSQRFGVGLTQATFDTFRNALIAA